MGTNINETQMKDAILNKIPQCQFCGTDAAYDAKTNFGPWAYVCEAHYKSHCVQHPGLGFRLKLSETAGLKIVEGK